MNRDQTIIKTIQKTIEIASGKIEKTIKLDTVHAAQKQTGPRPARPPFFGPEARQPTAGPPNRPAAASPPPPAWAACQPRRRGVISTVDLDRTVARAVRRIKTDDAGVSRNPSDSFSLPLLSPRERRRLFGRRRERPAPPSPPLPARALSRAGARRRRAG